MKSQATKLEQSMSLMVKTALAALTAAGTLPAAASAQERIISFELGLGPGAAPVYEGSGDYGFSPAVTARLTRLSFGKLNIGGGNRSTGFSLGPSFRYLGERKSADHAELTGMPDNDATIELGVKLSYDWDRLGTFATLRKGLTGHSGLAGEVGADVRFAVNPDTTITIGPRVSYGDRSYMNYAFGVPTSATALNAYAAGGGVRSIGAEMRVRYDFSEKSSLEGYAKWERLQGDAARSPITQTGDQDQLRIGMMYVRSFNIRF